MAVVAKERHADPLGVYLLRGIDNQDKSALNQAAFMLSRAMTGRYRMSGARTRKIAEDVITFLCDQRCGQCQGRKYIISDESGVHNACHACNATGVLGVRPNWWKGVHDQALRMSLGAIRSALASAKLG